jgi:4-amino-4-deoxy-L-arabinose transferase-like glycosyltransferase
LPADPPASSPTGPEWLAPIGLLALVFAAYLFRLDSIVVADMDEGTYLYAGKLVSSGQVPYRDFLLTHPPVIAYLAGLWVAVFGSGVMPARIGYAILVLASTLPLSALTRTLTGSRLAGLLAMSSYTAGMLLVANMGRTIRLEPLMNAALIAAVAVYLLAPRRAPWLAAAGMLFALAVLVKLVAVIPIGVLLAAELWLRRDGLIRRWALTAAGAAAVLLPAAAVLLSEPRFVEDVFVLQLERPGLPLAVRIAFVVQDFVRDPLIPLSLVAACWYIARPTEARLRAIALVAVGSGLALVILFRTFFGYYLVQDLPWLSVCLAAGAADLGRRAGWAWWPRATAAAIIALAIVIPLAYDEAYYRTAHEHVSSAAPIAAALAEGTGPLYSMYPSFALWSGRPACASYYAADSLIARITGRFGDDDFVSLFSRCPTLVLWTGELADYPRALAYVTENFTPALTNADYALWTKKAGR